jgi:hypothetical protein
MVETTGGNITPITGIDGINNIFGADYILLDGTGNPMAAAANIRANNTNMQTSVSMKGGKSVSMKGGKSVSMKGGKSVTIPVSTVPGASAASNLITTDLTTMGASIAIQNALYKQVGGKRRKKSRVNRTNKKRTNKKRGNKKRGNKKRTNKKRGNKKRTNKKRTTNKLVNRRRNKRGLRVHI